MKGEKKNINFIKNSAEIHAEIRYHTMHIECSWTKLKERVKTYIVLRHRFSLVYDSKAFFHKEVNSDI